MRAAWLWVAACLLWGCQPIGSEEEPRQAQDLIEGDSCTADSQCQSRTCWLGQCYGRDCKKDETICRAGYSCAHLAGGCNIFFCNGESASCLQPCHDDTQCALGYECQSGACLRTDKPVLTVPDQQEAPWDTPVKLRVTAEAPRGVLNLRWCFITYDRYNSEQWDCTDLKPEQLTLEPEQPHGGPVYSSEMMHTFTRDRTAYTVVVSALGGTEEDRNLADEREQRFSVLICAPAGGSCTEKGWPSCCSGLSCAITDPQWGEGTCQ